jgi:hypothetical protein
VNSPELAELRTQYRPLQAIFEEIVEAGWVKRRQARAHKLVENFKRISVQQVTDTLETLWLADLVVSVVELYSINARAAHLDIHIVNHLPPGQPT